MKHKWVDKHTEGEGEGKVDTATCSQCGLKRRVLRQGEQHFTVWGEGVGMKSSLDGHQTPECCS